MEIAVIIIVVGIILISWYFFPVQVNRYGERRFGRKHLERDVNALSKAIFPNSFETKKESIERKEKTRVFVDHIIGSALLSEEEAWKLFNELFCHLENVELGKNTLNLLGNDIITAKKNKIKLKYEDASSPAERTRYFFLRANIRDHGIGCSSFFYSLIHNLSILCDNREGKSLHIDEDLLSKDMERIEKLENIRDEFEKAKD